MEITLAGKDSIKVKSKKASFVIDPDGVTTKTSADAIALLHIKDTIDYYPKVEGTRLTIVGPGEYEVGGMKFAVTRNQDALSHIVRLDNLEILIAPSDALQKSYTSMTSCHVLVLKATVPVDASLVSALAPNTVVLYGDQAEACAKALGKDDAQKTTKFVTTAEKLPAEMEVVILQ